MGALIATIFTVIVVAISSIAITNPNINFDNRSKAMMPEGGGGNIPKTTPKPTAGSANAQIGVTVTPKPTATPSCSCVGGYLQNCGAGSGAPCSANVAPSSTPKTPANSEDAAATLVERKECQMNGGAWTNSKCVYPTSTVSLPKPTTSSTPDSCGGGMVCSSKSSTTCVNAGGEPTSCTNSTGASGNCCSSTSTPTATPITSPTQAAATTPLTCIKEGGTYKDGTSCCSPLVKVVTPYGAYCGKKGDCSTGSKKCQKDGVSYFEYTCDSSGYYQKDKRCDFGCNGNSCSTGGCTTGQTRCDSSRPNELETCTGTAWNGQSCDNGCETISSTKAQCKTLSCTNPAGTPNVTKICNNAGGYNYCSSDGKWYSKKCEEGQTCVSGQCVLPASGCTDPTTTNGGTVCTNTGKSYNVCNNGSWFNVKCNTGEICSGGKCVVGALKAEGETCGAPGECASGFCYNELEATGQLDLIGEGNRCHNVSSSDTVQQYYKDQVDVAKEIAPMYIVGALAIPASGVANAIDDFSTIAQCALTQDPGICQWAVVTLVNPLPGTSLVKNAVGEGGEDLLKLSDDSQKIINNLNVSRENSYIKSVTNFDIDSPDLASKIADDIENTNVEYKLPGIQLARENPLEYENQINQIAKQNDIDIIPFDGSINFCGSGICYKAGESVNGLVFTRPTVIVKPSADSLKYSQTLTHEIVHGMQNQLHPDMSIEMMEYQAYISELNPSKVRTGLTPEILIPSVQHNFLGSVDSWYVSQELIPPTSFPFNQID